MTQTYFLDIDGVLLVHYGSLGAQLADENLSMITKTRKFLDTIEKNGAKIVLTTGRRNSTRKQTEDQLRKLNIFYDELVMGCGRGERIVVNDLKPNSNMKTAFSFTPNRNGITEDEIEKIIKPCEERPWGNFSTLAYDKKYHVKEIKVLPGKASSLQSHQHRDELWLIIEGNGIFVLEDNQHPIEKGSVCQVKKNEKHRVVNTGDTDLIFIEIQTGEKFSEDDITRYEDQFGRV